MKNSDKIPSNNVLKNTGTSRNKIRLNMFNGILDGNILEEPIYPPIVAQPTCEENTLNFECNSQYIPLL